MNSIIQFKEKGKHCIYLDNAATSYPKPEPVYQAINHILRHIGGNASRNGHRMAMEASRVVFDARESVASLFNIKDASRIVFTKNVTEAINIALKGILKPGDHVVTSSIEHNAVIKPLKMLEGRGVKVTMVDAQTDGWVKPEEIEKAITGNTKLVSVTHASNVLGTILPVADIGAICRKKKVIFMVDAAQTAGAMPVNTQELNIDILCATGHKSLFGPQGTGLLYLREGIEPLPLIDAGSDENNEKIEIPDRLEAGTINTPGIGGLGAGIEFIIKEGVDKIRKYEEGLTRQILDGMRRIKGINILGPLNEKKRASLVAFTISGKDPVDIGNKLDLEFDIMSRFGLHCAHYAHKTAGTYPHGAVRISPGYFNTENEIDAFLRAMREIAK